MISPKVSVYITTHNRVEKLKRAVNSVLEQTYKNIEIIICDDASTDGTKLYSESLVRSDNRVVYLRNNENKGACAARNLGILNARGEFITGLDDDDEFEKNRIQYFLNVWDAKYSFLCCDFLEKYQDGTSGLYYKCKKEKIVKLNELLIENIVSNQVFTLTERLVFIGGFDTRARRLQDWDTWIRLVSEFGDAIRYPDATYIMNHDHSKSEARVSSSYPLKDALFDLYSRNILLYNSKNSLIMKFIISCLNGDARFSNALKIFFLSGNIKLLGKFFKYKFKR